MRPICAVFGLTLIAAAAGCPARPSNTMAHAPDLARSRPRLAEGDAGPATGPQSNDASAARSDAAPGVQQPLLNPGMQELWSTAARKKVGANACDAAEDTVARAARAVLEQAPERVTISKPWNRAHPPRHLARMQERFALTAAEKSLLRKNGFVVAARLEQPGFTRAFHEIHQSQLPVYVSVDAIFHAVFKSHEQIVSSIEMDLADRQGALLTAMHTSLPAAAPNWPKHTSEDVDVYLTVARSLLADQKVASTLGHDAIAAPLVAAARKANTGLTAVSLFGRRRVVDFSAFAPRGYYATAFEGALAPYFRASMWLSRLEFNLVSRASRSSEPGIVPNPAETPREAVVALALAELAQRAGVLADLDVLESAWEGLGGKREDVSIRQLLALRGKAQISKLVIPDSADALRAAIGGGHGRTARIHYMPQGSTPLPAISTLLGPRVLPDAVALTHVTHADVTGRDLPRAADVAFLLGHDRAAHYLRADLAQHAALRTHLDTGRRTLAQEVAPGMFGAWLEAIRRLGDEPQGQVPTYTKTDAFRDARIASAVAAYGQLRHGAVLVAGQPYSEGGCEIPDGYVDPVPEVYAKLAEYARRGHQLATRAKHNSGMTYFARLEQTLSVLTVIAKNELAGRALSEAEKRWLAMIVEVEPPSSDSAGSYNGWYFDLFSDIDTAFAEENFVADWATGSNTGTVAAIGAVAPRLGLFVVDQNGPPRVFVGPVAHAFEMRQPLAKRPKDADKIAKRHRIAPWLASHVAPAPRAPALKVVGVGVDYMDDKSVHRFAVQSATPIQVELLDHHRGVVANGRGGGSGAFMLLSVASTGSATAERVRIRAGGFSWETSSEALGGMVHLSTQQGAEPDPQAVYDLRQKLTQLLLRPRTGTPARRGSSL